MPKDGKVRYMVRFKKLSLIPCLLPLIIAISIGLLNMKRQSNVRILLWESPPMSIGLWIIFASSTSAIFTYTLTSNFKASERTFRRKVNINARDIENKDYYSDEVDQIDSDAFTNKGIENKFMPERDPRDPAPTVAVPFTIIKRGNEQPVSTVNSYQVDYDEEPLDKNENIDYGMENSDQDEYYNQQVELNTTDDWYKGDFEEW